MSKTITIIQREHRAFAAVLYTLDHVLAEIRDGKIEPDFALFDAILTYIRDFPDRFHHPKEDDVLFPLVSQRAAETRDAIAELKQQHHEGVRLTSDLTWKLDAWKSDPARNFAAFDAAARQYIEWQRKHMALEERTVLPAARAKLTEADWAKADASFADNDDPIFGANPKGSFDRLLARIATLAPDPFGLGSRKERRAPEEAVSDKSWRERLVHLHWL